MMKVVSSSIQGYKDDSSHGAAELGMRLHKPYHHMTESGAPIYSSVSKSQMGYIPQRVKDKIAKQLHKNKNKELLAEVVEKTPVEGVEGYSNFQGGARCGEFRFHCGFVLWRLREKSFGHFFSH